MNILVVAATRFEVDLILKAQEKPPPYLKNWFRRNNLQVLITGVGMVNTALRLGQYGSNSGAIWINIGIAGSFLRDLAIGQTVEIVEDCFAELGAESPEGFLPLDKLGFPSFVADKAYFNEIANPKPSRQRVEKVSALTVNTITGTDASAEVLRQRWNKDLESMEGAAFFQAALQNGRPFYAFRAISNYVEERDPKKWNIPLACHSVQEFFLQNIESLSYLPHTAKHFFDPNGS